MSGVFIEEVAAQTVEPSGNDRPAPASTSPAPPNPETILAIVRRENERLARLTVD